MIALQGNLLDTGRHPTRASGVEVTKSRSYRETRIAEISALLYVWVGPTDKTGKSVVRYGTLRMRLNKDSKSPFNEQIVSISRDIPPDVNGNIAGTVVVWSNSYLKPDDRRYVVTASSAQGQPVWGKWSVTIPPVDIYDVGTLTPQNQ